jgi:hypothetical protein
VTNLDLDAPGSPIDPAGLHHLNITASPAVQAWVLGQVLGGVEAAGPGRPGTSRRQTGQATSAGGCPDAESGG